MTDCTSTWQESNAGHVFLLLASWIGTQTGPQFWNEIHPIYHEISYVYHYTSARSCCKRYHCTIYNSWFKLSFLFAFVSECSFLTIKNALNIVRCPFAGQYSTSFVIQFKIIGEYKNFLGFWAYHVLIAHLFMTKTSFFYISGGFILSLIKSYCFVMNT